MSTAGRGSCSLPSFHNLSREKETVKTGHEKCNGLLLEQSLVPNPDIMKIMIWEEVVDW